MRMERSIILSFQTMAPALLRSTFPGYLNVFTEWIPADQEKAAEPGLGLLSLRMQSFCTRVRFQSEREPAADWNSFLHFLNRFLFNRGYWIFLNHPKRPEI